MIGCPPNQPELHLAKSNITSGPRASAYKLDLSFIDMPVLDDWG